MFLFLFLSVVVVVILFCFDVFCFLSVDNLVHITSSSLVCGAVPS